MELYELELKQLVEVKLLRLNKPKFSNNLLPLNGSYNSIEHLNKITSSDFENSSETRFESVLKEFNINESNSVSVDNMFQLQSGFGKVLFCETLEALIIINNTSDKEIKIKDLKIRVTNEVLENYESMFKKSEYTLINSNSLIVIPANHFYNQKIKLNADVMCKYSLETDIQYSSTYFNEEYVKYSLNKIIKSISNGYYVEVGTNNVVRKYYKKFLFATNLPFKIKDKFINESLDKSYIEINILNQSPYNLHISEFLFAPDTSVSTQVGNYISCLQEMKNFNIEPDEEVNLVYTISNYRSFVATV